MIPEVQDDATIMEKDSAIPKLSVPQTTESKNVIIAIKNTQTKTIKTFALHKKPEKSNRGTKQTATSHVMQSKITKAMQIMFDHKLYIPNKITKAMQILFNSTQATLDVIDAIGRLLNPPRDKMQSLGDSGFQGSKKDMPGADVLHSEKKTSQRQTYR